MSNFGRPSMTGLACASVAAAIGIAYLVAAGAPARHVLINLAAFAVGLAAYATIMLPQWRPGPVSHYLSPALGLGLFATALLGTPVEGAARWVTVGPLNLQLSLILVPAMVMSFARSPNAAGVAGIGLAALALAWQPDRGMAGVLAAAMLVLALRRRERPVLMACGFAFGAFAATLVQPDALPAVAFVDRIFHSSFGIHPLLGLALVAGAGLLSVPGLAVRGGDGGAGQVFAAMWAAVSVAAAMGNYPTPVVGYGGSAIVGYLLSLAVLVAGAEARERGRTQAGADRGGAGPGASSLVASLA